MKAPETLKNAKERKKEALMKTVRKKSLQNPPFAPITSKHSYHFENEVAKTIVDALRFVTQIR